MRSAILRSIAILLTIASLSLVAGAQANEKASGGGTPSPSKAELAVTYDFERSNAPPGGCSCFSLNGGGANFAWPVKPRGFALAGDFSVTHSSGSYELTLAAFTAGARYKPPVPHWPVQPFGQVLIGVAHASGPLVEGRSPAVSNSGAAFAAKIGGGLDLRADRRMSIRLIEADYLVTTFDNGSNDHQNILHIGVGVVFRF